VLTEEWLIKKDGKIEIKSSIRNFFKNQIMGNKYTNMNKRKEFR